MWEVIAFNVRADPVVAATSPGMHNCLVGRDLDAIRGRASLLVAMLRR